MTTVYAPEGIAAADIVGTMGRKGIVVAGGLHKDIKSEFLYNCFVPRVSYPSFVIAKYFRIG
jgi:hypothetical protein